VLRLFKQHILEVQEICIRLAAINKAMQENRAFKQAFSAGNGKNTKSLNPNISKAIVSAQRKN